MQPRQLQGFQYASARQNPQAVFQALEQQRLMQMQQRQMQQMPQPKKKRGLAASLLPAGAAIGAGLLAAPLTGGLSLAGTIAALGLAGGIGSAAGELGAQKLNNEKLNVGRIGKEGLLGGAFGAGGAAFGAVRGARAAKAAGMFGDDAAQFTKQVAAGTARAKDAGKIVSGVDPALARSVQSRGLGAFEPKEGLRAIPKATERVATANEFGIKSGYKGLQQATQKMGQLETELTPLLTKARVPVKNVNSALDNIMATTSADVADPTLRRTIASAKQAVTNASKSGYVSGAELRSIRAKLGQDIFSGAGTASKDLRQEIYRAYGDAIGAASPKAKGLLSKQHKLLDLGPGLAKRAEDVRLPIPLTGTGGKIPGIAGPRDRAMDLIGALQGAGRTGAASPVVPQALRQGVPRALGVGSSPQEQPVDPTMLGPEGGMEQPVNPMTDPMQDPMGGQMEEAPQSMYGQENLMADIQRDPKNAQKYITLYESLAKQQQATTKGSSLNVTKPSSEKFSNALTGMQALQQLQGILQSDPSVLSKTRTPGRGINVLGIGSNIRKATGTGEFDALAFNAVDNLLRIRTGAQAPESEIRRYMNQIIPQAGDTPQTVQRKLTAMEQTFGSILSLADQGVSGQSTATDDLTSALMGAQGYGF